MSKDKLSFELNIEISTCPCCGNTPYIWHSSNMDMSLAKVVCKCGLELERSSSFNSYQAEKAAIKAWNKAAKKRTKVKTYRENE